MRDEENINEDQSIDKEIISKLDHVLNTDDRDFQQILVDLGFIDDIHLLGADDYGVTADELTGDELTETATHEDYDVEELTCVAKVFVQN